MQVLKFFSSSDAYYQVIFTSNASGTCIATMTDGFYDLLCAGGCLSKITLAIWRFPACIHALEALSVAAFDSGICPKQWAHEIS